MLNRVLLKNMNFFLSKFKKIPSYSEYFWYNYDWFFLFKSNNFIIESR